MKILDQASLLADAPSACLERLQGSICELGPVGRPPPGQIVLMGAGVPRSASESILERRPQRMTDPTASLISCTPDVRSGKPCLAGRRNTVSDVLEDPAGSDLAIHLLLELDRRHPSPPAGSSLRGRYLNLALLNAPSKP